MIQTNKGNFNGELDGEKRLNWFLLLFLNTQYQTEEENIFWRDLATGHHAGATADLLAEEEVPTVASDRMSERPLVEVHREFFWVPN